VRADALDTRLEVSEMKTKICKTAFNRVCIFISDQQNILLVLAIGKKYSSIVVNCVTHILTCSARYFSSVFFMIRNACREPEEAKLLRTG
jgi:hypothetical protein